jgi:4-amino-4-deoxy-L-arabinose transferase-like glycosyltransferase
MSRAEQPQLAAVGGTPSYWRQNLGVLGVLLLIGFALRFPFFFPAVVHWDESTFILVGQSILGGHLPYTEMWDLKPPLLPAFFALVIATCGKNLLAIRVAGTLCVVMTGWLVYLTATRVWNKRTGIVAAILSILAASLLEGGQATMSEHVALVPLVWAMYILIRWEPSRLTLFIAGALLATATLIRLNLAYVVVLCGLYVLAMAVCRADLSVAACIAAFTGGGLVVAALTIAPYVLAGELDLLWTSLIVAPLTYASTQASLLEAALEQTAHAFGVYGRSEIHVPWLTALLWLGGAIGFGVGLWRWRQAGDAERRGFGVVSLFAVGTAVGIAKGGAVAEHYMIQLVPFAALFGASLVDRWPRYGRRAVLVVTSVAAAVSLRPVLVEYRTLVVRLMAGEELRQGPEYEIAAYLKQEGARGRPIYLLRDQIVYWFLESFPLTRLTTHPSNIGKPALLSTVVGKGASTEGELTKVFEKNPEVVVTEDHVVYLTEGAQRRLERILADEYVLAKEIQGRKIFRRKG